MIGQATSAVPPVHQWITSGTEWQQICFTHREDGARADEGTKTKNLVREQWLLRRASSEGNVMAQIIEFHVRGDFKDHRTCVQREESERLVDCVQAEPKPSQQFTRVAWMEFIKWRDE